MSSHRRDRHRDPSVPHRRSARGARRSAAAYRRDALAPQGARRPIGRRACSWRRCRSSPAIWENDYDWRRCEARLNALPQFKTEIDGVDVHFIHVKSRARERVAADHDARLARFGHRTARDRRSADRSDCAWRERRGRVPPRAAVRSRLRVLRRADGTRLEPRPHRAGLGRADAAPRLHPLRRARRRRGRRHHRRDGSRGTAGSGRHPHQLARDRAGRRRTTPRTPTRKKRRPRRSPHSGRPASATSSSRPHVRRRSATPCWIHRSRWRPGCSTTTPTATRRSRTRSSTSSPPAISPATTSSTTSRRTG